MTIEPSAATPARQDTLMTRRVNRAVEVLLDTADSLMDVLRAEAGPSETGPAIAAIWAEAEALNAALVLRRDTASEDDQATGYGILYEMEDRVLADPIRSRADALAKLKAVAVWRARGEKADGGDVDGLAQVIAWMDTAREAA